MDVLYERCWGWTSTRRRSWRAWSTPAGRGRRAGVRTFGTMTDDLLALADWLEAGGSPTWRWRARACTGSRSGTCWRSASAAAGQRAARQGGARAQDRRAGQRVAGGVAAARAVAGELRARRPQRELRELTRYRTALVRERSAEVNRLQKTLEGANIKLASVASDVVGVSGAPDARPLVAGPDGRGGAGGAGAGEAAAQADGAGAGPHRPLGRTSASWSAQHLAHIDALDEQVAPVSAQIAERLRPFEPQLASAWTRSPGVGHGRRSAPRRDRRRTWRVPHGGAPGQLGGDVSGARRERRQAALRQDPQRSPWLRATLMEAAYAAGRSKET